MNFQLGSNWLEDDAIEVLTVARSVWASRVAHAAYCLYAFRASLATDAPRLDIEPAVREALQRLYEPTLWQRFVARLGWIFYDALRI